MVQLVLSVHRALLPLLVSLVVVLSECWVKRKRRRLLLAAEAGDGGVVVAELEVVVLRRTHAGLRVPSAGRSV